MERADIMKEHFTDTATIGKDPVCGMDAGFDSKHEYVRNVQRFVSAVNTV
jgi:hypothetical protein